MKPLCILRFGVFEADLRSGELRKRGAQIKLQYQPFQILVALLNRPGELVTREELRQQLWPADTFVDFDHSLNAAVKRLRDALGESADAPNLIETLPRRGYRFLGSVTAVGVDASQSAAQTAVAPERPAHTVDKRGNGRRYALPAVAALLFLAAIGIYFRYDNWLTPFAGSAALPPAKVVPFTTDPGAEMHPAFSPDGKQAAYVKWDGQSNFDANVYVKLIGGNQELQITHDSGWACCTTWSPDGLFVAYERCDGDHQGIFVVPSMGGPERRLTDESCEGISWSPDGAWIAIARGEPTSPQSIFLLRMRDLQLQRLTSPVSPDRGDHLPEFSPDGKLVAFVRQTSATVDDLFVIPARGGEPRQLTTDNTGIHGLAWTSDGRSLVFTSHRAGGTSLWKIAAVGGTPVSVPVGGADVEDVSIASTGNRLLYTQGAGIRPNIWEIPLGPDRQAKTSRPLLASTTGQGNPQFSPDGNRIAFYSRRSGSPEIWVCNSDGSNPVQLTSLGVLTETPRWSPDGKTIAFDSRPAGHSQILLMPSGGGEPRPLTGPENESALSSWSRDGRWIYFTSNRGGSWQIWKIPSEGGKSIQVTENGGFVAFESADGKNLVYTKRNEFGFWMRSIRGGPESKILDVRVFFGHWALGRNGVYFVDQAGMPATVKYFDFAEHKVSQVAALARPVPPEEAGLAVSPDERRILVMEVVTDKDIMLLENFH